MTLIPLDDELVVFSEEAQCLIGLNVSAAFVFRHLQEGMPPSELVQTIASEGLAAPEGAERWVTATIDALRSHGILADGSPPTPPSMGMGEEDKWRTVGIPPYVPFQAVAERRYRLLETCALIRFAHAGQLRLADAVIGHLATDDGSAPTVVMDIQAVKLDDGHLRSNIYRDGIPIVYAPRLSHLGPVIKGALWQSAINAHDFLFYIHAGVVGTDKSCILLPAAAGSGKSSLTAALTHKGFRYYSDEVALIERGTFQVPAMPLAICVKSTGWDLMARYYPQLSALPTHWRDDGKLVRYIPPPPQAAQQPPAPVSHIFFPRHEKDAPTELKPIARSEALGRLMDECLAVRLRLDRNTVEDLARWIAAIDCYALTFSSLDQAVELVAQVAPRKIA